MVPAVAKCCGANFSRALPARVNRPKMRHSKRRCLHVRVLARLLQRAELQYGAARLRHDAQADRGCARRPVGPLSGAEAIEHHDRRRPRPHSRLLPGRYRSRAAVPPWPAHWLEAGLAIAPAAAVPLTESIAAALRI